MQKVKGDAAVPPAASDRVDDRSERNISRLLPHGQPMRGLVLAAQAVEIEINVINGTRSYAEQDALHAKGGTIPDADKVTNAKGGHSNLYFFVASNRWIVPLAQGLSRSPIRNKFPRDIRPI